MADDLKVLVVDDEPGMRMGVERALRHFGVEFADLQTRVGFTVARAASGEEALERIPQERPDLLLLDYKLPGISGLEVQDRLMAAGQDVLTVMISAYSSLQTVITATKRGAFDFLVKPFTPEELRATLRKAAHHLLVHRQALRLAEERRQIRFEFIRVLGHELKAPLAAVEGYLRLVQKRGLGADLQAYGAIVDRSLLRLEGMRKLILDLLDLTRIESGNRQRDLVPLDVCPMVDAALETAAPEAARRGITLRAERPPSVPMTADRGELEIILNNLLSNAVKYNRDQGWICVSLEDLGERLRLRVADSGIGMTEAETARLFGEFVRIKNERTASILGSGLGLSIVRKLVSLYQGEVSVDSTPDVGTTFTGLLDKAPPPAAGAVPPASPPAGAA
ncbi:MAG: HAMP domain-containing sensor histidine kinase [Candidatus Latescibacterota bacterium]